MPVRQTIATQCCFRRTSFRPQTMFAKVMFLHLSVNRGGMHGSRVACMSRVAGMAGGLACIVRGGVHGRCMCMAGWCECQGACVARGCALWDTVGQCAGSTHPTGMHSCFKMYTIIYRLKTIINAVAFGSESTVCHMPRVILNKPNTSSIRGHCCQNPLMFGGLCVSTLISKSVKWHAWIYPLLHIIPHDKWPLRQKGVKTLPDTPILSAENS